MTLSTQALAEFKDLWFKHYEQNLCEEDLSKYAGALMTLYEAIYQPVPKEHKHFVQPVAEYVQAQINH
jgi:hypothetical protein